MYIYHRGRRHVSCWVPFFFFFFSILFFGNVIQSSLQELFGHRSGYSTHNSSGYYDIRVTCCRGSRAISSAQAILSPLDSSGTVSKPTYNPSSSPHALFDPCSLTNCHLITMQSSFALRFLTSLSPWTITYASLGGVSTFLVVVLSTRATELALLSLPAAMLGLSLPA